MNTEKLFVKVLLSPSPVNPMWENPACLTGFLKKTVQLLQISPGTTRDTIEEQIDLDGIAVTLVDTAGIRETYDPVEREGTRRSQQFIDRAAIVLYIVDGSLPPSSRELDNIRRVDRAFLVLNKSDLGLCKGWQSRQSRHPRSRFQPKQAMAFPSYVAAFVRLFLERVTYLPKSSLKNDIFSHFNRLHQDCSKLSKVLNWAIRVKLLPWISESHLTRLPLLLDTPPRMIFLTKFSKLSVLANNVSCETVDVCHFLIGIKSYK